MPDYNEVWKYELASDIYAYPSANASDKGDVNSEENIAGITRHLTQKNFIIRYSSNEDPMLLGYDGISGDITIAKGSCLIDGYYIELENGISAPPTDFVDIEVFNTSTLYVILKLIRDTTGNIRGDYVEVSPNGVQSVCHGVAWSVLTKAQFDDLKSTDTPYLEIGQFIEGKPVNSPIRYAYISTDKMYEGTNTLEQLLDQAGSAATSIADLENRVAPLEREVTGQNGLLSSVPSDITNHSLLNLIYPIGSIYMSVNPTNPHDLFGGTWEAIHGRFLVAEGNNNATGAENLDLSAGSHGGEKNHTLTVGQIPSHSHAFTPSSHYHSLLSTDGSVGVTTWAAATGTLHFYETKHSPPNDFQYVSGSGAGTGDLVPYTRNTRNYVTRTTSDPATGSIGNTGGGQSHNNLPPYLAVYMWKRVS